MSPNPATAASSALLSDEDFARVQSGYGNSMEVGPRTEPRLRMAIEHVLANPGSLVRAQLAYQIMRARAVNESDALAVAVAIEYFHTASLVFDDMPAMDHATERRGSPCVHVRFDEATATLAALAFITRAYALLWQAIGKLPATARSEAAQLVSSCLGVDGILNGQSRDLQFHDSAGQEQDVLEVAEGKTVTLIRLTLLLPALVGGVSAADRAILEELSQRWGLAYQVMDDFKDGLMTPAETGKTAARDVSLHRPNLPAVLGWSAARSRLDTLMAEARTRVASLQQRDPAWQILQRLQVVLDREQARIQTRLLAVA